MPGGNRVGDGLAGPLHEVDAGHTPSDRQAVSLGHFGIAQKLKHAPRR
jgi:hypothetical protein